MLGGERLVRAFTSFYVALIDRRIRWPMRRCTGTVHSRLCVPVVSKLVISFGSQRAVSMHLTIVSIVGRLNTQTM